MAAAHPVAAAAPAPAQESRLQDSLKQHRLRDHHLAMALPDQTLWMVSRPAATGVLTDCSQLAASCSCSPGRCSKWPRSTAFVCLLPPPSPACSPSPPATEKCCGELARVLCRQQLHWVDRYLAALHLERRDLRPRRLDPHTVRAQLITPCLNFGVAGLLSQDCAAGC